MITLQLEETEPTYYWMKGKCCGDHIYRHKLKHICSHLLISLPITPGVLHKVLGHSAYPKNFSRFPEMHLEKVRQSYRTVLK